MPGYSFAAPWPWLITPEKYRTDSLLTENCCILRGEDYFIRGCLEIPVHGEDEPFIWGVWVSLSRERFKREKRLADDPKRVEEPPYVGWFCSRVPIYPDTLLLKARVHCRPVGTRPFIELQPTDHLLAVEQRSGISVQRVREIFELMQEKWWHPEWDAKGLYGAAVEDSQPN